MSRKSAKNRFLLYLLLGCSLLFNCPGCEKGKENKEETSFEIDKPYERGPLTVHVRLDKGKITIAETVILELEAAIEPSYELRMPKVDRVLENFGIVDWDNLGNKLDENNNIVSTYRYRLEPFLSGNYAIPAFTFEFNDANGIEENKYELTTEPIDIEVTSLLGEQRSELVIADIEDVVEMPKEVSYWWIWVIGPICLITAIGTWFYLRRKRHAKLIRIFKPAHEIAYERLRVLVKDDLITAGEIKEFYERISNILRHYIEHRFELRAPERTTEEFLIELQWTDVLSAPDKETIGEFLRHCDLVKFAKYNPTNEQIQQTFDLVKDFIEKTKSDERRIDITDNVVAEETVESGVT
jgi:hypothetical protein